MPRPLLSIIVPSYNRPQHLPLLLDSVLAQNFADWELVVGEDCSPARDEVKRIVAEYAAKSAGRIRLNLHPDNLGYDGSLRTLVQEARGKYLFILGDDDYVASGALSAVADAVARYPNAGLILRAFAWFVGTPDNVIQITRYYPRELHFPAGKPALVACFRRLVVMSGLVLDRDLANACATDRWDGSLFYQHWMAGNVLAQKDAVYIPDILVYFRKASPSMFGMAKAEREFYTPGGQPPDMHVRMVKSQLQIAEAVEKQWGIPFSDDFRRDLANYAFIMFANQSHVSRKEFFRYYRDLGGLGLDKYVAFHAWYWAVKVFGARNIDRILQAIRKRAGYTPNLTRAARPIRAREAR